MSHSQDSSDDPSVDSEGTPTKKPQSTLGGINAGYIIVASVLLGLGLGYAVDNYCDTWPWWTIGGGSLFILAGLYQVVKEHM